MSMTGEKNELQKVSEETMRFMRGNYSLDEFAYGETTLKFRQGKKTVLSIEMCDGHYVFQIIFGKAEREKFDAARDEFPQVILDIYDKSHTYHDGKWMFIKVADIETLEAVKKLILIKKKPNRKPFKTDNAVYASCGHRCDLCVHYTGGTISDEWRLVLRESVARVYDAAGEYGEDMMLCPGCYNHPKENKLCDEKRCSAEKGLLRCTDCPGYACDNATAGYRPRIEARSISAEDVTWAILPFVPKQYGN